MADYIDRQATVDAVHKAWMDGAYYTEIMDALKGLPSADVQLVRHGTWLPYLKEGITVKCSECGSRFDRPWHYCPSCGARMNEERKGERT